MATGKVTIGVCSTIPTRKLFDSRLHMVIDSIDNYDGNDDDDDNKYDGYDAQDDEDDHG